MLDFTAFARFFPENIHTIAVTAPASPAHDPQLANQCLRALTDTGRDIRVMPNARLGEPGDAYSAIDAHLRAEDLEQAWKDPEVQLIIPLRGGGGGRELVETLDWNSLKQRPYLPVLGFSDLTILHAAMMAKHCGRPIISPTLMDIPAMTPDSIQAASRALAGKDMPPYALKPLQHGPAKGPVFAAHLQRLASLLESPYMPQLDGKMLFIECPHRKEDQIVAIFRQLVQSGHLNSIQALICGQFPDCTSPQAAQNMQRHMAEMLNCPVAAGFPFGHTTQFHTLDTDAEARLTANGTLTITPAPPIH